MTKIPAALTYQKFHGLFKNTASLDATEKILLASLSVYSGSEIFTSCSSLRYCNKCLCWCKVFVPIGPRCKSILECICCVECHWDSHILWCIRFRHAQDISLGYYLDECRCHALRQVYNCTCTGGTMISKPCQSWANWTTWRGSKV